MARRYENHDTEALTLPRLCRALREVQNPAEAENKLCNDLVLAVEQVRETATAIADAAMSAELLALAERLAGIEAALRDPGAVHAG